jgi:L-rhamnose-H+ transport protein
LNPNPLLGVVYHWAGGLSAASCYLPFRAIRRWSWEIYWLLQGVFSWVIAPSIFAALLVPGWFAAIAHAPSSALLYSWFWGAMWGIGGLTFGLGVRYLGVALGYTIALGFSTAFGTLMPPLFAGELTSIAHGRSGQVILLGVAICMAAIVVSGLAGLRKERELSASHMLRTGAVREFSYRKGVIVATFAGIMSACFAYGLAAAKPIDTFARANLIQGGRSDLWQHLPGLVVVLWGGFTTNFLWCAWLLVKNRSASQFVGRTAQGRIAVRSHGFEYRSKRSRRTALVLPVLLLLHGPDSHGPLRLLKLDAAHGRNHPLRHPLGRSSARMERHHPPNSNARRHRISASRSEQHGRRLRKLSQSSVA